MYIDRAERAWKNHTNLPAHEKLKCILKILKFRTPPSGWGQTQNIQKLFWGCTLEVRCTLAEPEENGKMTQTHS